MIRRANIMIMVTIAALIAFAPNGCHSGEQAVAGVAENAATAEHKAQAVASVQEQERTQLARIPLPTKSLYIDVHEPGAWLNPFLSVGAETLNLRIEVSDANPSDVGQGTILRPRAARRQEVELRLDDLAEALIALPPSAWRYGRVIAVVESPLASGKDRVRVRRNVESVLQQLNDLGVVAEEWPGR